VNSISPCCKQGRKYIFTNSTDRYFSIEELEHAKKIAARVVTLYGDTYLPIFQRVLDEINKAKQAETIKQLALKEALSYSERS